MRKLIYLLLSVFLILVSCKSERKTCRIGVSQCSDDEWRRVMNDELRREILFYPETELVFRTAYDDNDRQIADIEWFISQKVDALIIAPNEADAIAPVIGKAYDSGIPVILVDRKINSEKYTAYVGADNFEIGYRAGEYIVSRLAGEGRVLELTGLSGSTPAKERHAGFLAALENSPSVSVDVRETDWTDSVAFVQFTRYLEESGLPDVVYAHNDAAAYAAHKAAKKIGSEDECTFVGIDALPGKGMGVDMVSSGILNASLIYPTGGETVIKVTMAVINGEPYQRENKLSTELVTSDNARIMQMQTSQIHMLDEKIETLNGLLNSSMLRYASQRKILLVFVGLLCLVLLLLMLAIYGFRKLARMNHILSEQKREIEEQREAKLSFFTNVSHDFRTPLTLISDPVNQLKKSINLDDHDRYLLDIIYKNVTILRRLVNQILDFRKYESGKLELVLSDFDIVAALKDWTDIFSDLAYGKHITLNFEAAPECEGLRVVADMEKIERIAYNLLSNAFKFTPSNGTVSVRIALSDDRSRIIWTVSDSGIGMSDAHVNRVFEKFYQAPSVHHSGSGIGLALAKAFVEMHGGLIVVTSAKGAGTVFTIELPVVQQRDGTIAPDRHEHMSIMKDGALFDANQGTSPQMDDVYERGERECVLVVDDNADVRGYIRSLLIDRYNVIEASNGKEGLKKAVKSVPDAVICDVMMPVMDGMELCRSLKASVQTSHIPVMMLTAYSADEQKIMGYECGADSYISKPFTSDLLLARLRNLIDGHMRLQSIFGDTIPLSSESIAEIDKDFIGKLRKVIEDNLDNSSMTVEILGEKMCLGRVQLYRKTKALTGYSPNEYLRIARLKKASALLSSTDMTVAEVAYSVGFTSASYFAKCYREYFGETPKEFQKKV